MFGKKGSTSKKTLGLVKGSGQGLVYPEFQTFYTPTETPGESQDQTEQRTLGLHAVDALSRMRRALNLLWGTICLKMKKDDRQFLFTGCSRNDGVSFISFHLAMYLAMEHNLKVLFVDTDVERRKDEPMPFYPQGLPGLSSFVLSQTPLDGLILSTNVQGLKILPSGAGNKNCTGSNIMTKFQSVIDLADYAGSHFDVIIYDCKPVTYSPLAMSFAKVTNMILMVARYANSRREVCMQAVEIFRQNGFEVSGMVLNDRDYPIPAGIYNLIR